MYMKKIIASALVLSLSIGAVQAQSTPAKEKKEFKKDKKAGHMQDLNLSEDQKARMKTIREAQRAEMKAMKDASLTKEQSKAKRKEIHEKYRSQVQAVLNAEQKAKMEQMQAKRKEAGKNGQFKKERRADGAKGLNRIKGQSFGRNLDLTTEQQAKMKAIREEYKGQIEALRADKSTDKDQKRARMQELMKNQQAQMKSVLTKEQIEKLESSKKQRPQRNTK